MDIKTKVKTKIVTPPKLNENQRLNDGKCDPSGRLWVGSMNLDQKPKQAHLFRMDKEGTVKVMLDSISISNGIAWTKDGKRMFYIDTPTRKVMAYDFDLASGEISNPKVLVQIPDSLGWPDGMTLDENDNLWIGMWGGFCVTAWSAKDGSFLGKVSVPVPNVTSCAFGGKAFDILYITTARQGLRQEKLAAFPESGDLFKAEVGVKGRQMPYWKEK
jgi:sugar lactone lactonase YvrE